MNYKVHRAVVIGAGTMGAAIARRTWRMPVCQCICWMLLQIS
jgi:3-hydroxyacyl-CoA dehydrogenase